MSTGIFGVFDPQGVDRALALRAAQAVPFRGTPVATASDEFVIGVYGDGSTVGAVLDSASSIMVVDGELPDHPGGDPGGSGSLASVLDAALSSARRAAGLSSVSGPFAVAHLDRTRREVTLTRDAMGLRPLYWSRRGSAIAFASDPEYLFAFGVERDLHSDALASFLRFEDPGPEDTAFANVRRVPGGHTVVLSEQPDRRLSRWFAPERTPVEIADLREAASLFKTALIDAALAETRGGTVALSLSSGRDSVSIAAALAEAGVTATCLSFRFEDGIDCNEFERAAQVASTLGHRFRIVDIPSCPTPRDLAELPRLHGSPIGFPAYPLVTALVRAAAEEGADVLLDGTGGEPLFSAPPVVVLDLVRSGRLGDARAAARTFHREWTYPYGQTARAFIRGVSPGWLLARRERWRETPPWTDPASDRAVPGPADSRSSLLAACLAMGSAPERELRERITRAHGLRVSNPLLSRAVVDLALRLDVSLRAPVPVPKPVMWDAFLRPFEGVLTKTRQTPYFERLAACTRSHFPDWFDERSALVSRGLIPIDSLANVDMAKWSISMLVFVPVEAWLRRGDDADG